MNKDTYFDPLNQQPAATSVATQVDEGNPAYPMPKADESTVPAPIAKSMGLGSEPVPVSAVSTGYVPPYIQKMEKIKKLKESIAPMDKKDSAFMIAFFVWAFIFIDFAVMHYFNLGFTIAFFALFAIVTMYLRKKEVKPSAFSLACGVLSLAGSVTLAVFRDVFMNCIMVFLVAALFTIYSCGISGTFRNKEGSFKMLLDMLGGALIAPFTNISMVNTAFSKSVSKNKKLIHALIGIGISLPVLLVIVPLLVKSDAAFEGLVKAVLKNIGEYLLEAVLALIVTPYIISYMFSKKRNFKTGSEITTKDYSGARFSPNIVSVFFLCAISFVYIVYLFSQLAYFFDAFKGMLPSGYSFTASGYARRGFFEMFAIVCINIVLLSLVNVFTKRVEGGRQSKAVKGFATFISLFSVLMIVTAMRKMMLYIDIYGLTKYRLLVSVFMVMLFIIIGFFMLHIYLPKVSYMQPIILICSCIFIGISFADIDAQIAKYDVNAYKTGKIDAIDIYYLDELSASAVDYIIDLTNVDDEKTADNARDIIFDKINYDYSDKLKIDKDGVMVYTPNYDFREYNTVVDNACKTLRDFYNNLSAEDKAAYQKQKEYLDYGYSENFKTDIRDTWVDRGIVQNGAYTNASLGFEINFPEGWRIEQVGEEGYDGFYNEFNAFDGNSKWVEMSISTSSRYSSIEDYKQEMLTIDKDADYEVYDLGNRTIGNLEFATINTVFNNSWSDDDIALTAITDDGTMISIFVPGFSVEELDEFLEANIVYL